VIHVNQAPAVQDQSVATNEGTALEIILVATDADNDSLTYSIVTEPAHGTLSGTAPTSPTPERCLRWPQTVFTSRPMMAQPTVTCDSEYQRGPCQPPPISPR